MKPVGHWLNRADKALTRAMTGVLPEYGLTRLDWHLLNVIRDTAPEATDSAVLSALAAHADVVTLTTSVDAVLTGGWATRTARTDWPSPTTAAVGRPPSPSASRRSATCP
ncbi:hypothetical protein ACQPXS_23080 [Streptomyces sp. CA-142005]|uniref:hypothetical protein n=1 Tax=Streptomyces sp. CA-142005 TaxID=3240052 RepID=UPI003D9284B7